MSNPLFFLDIDGVVNVLHGKLQKHGHWTEWEKVKIPAFNKSINEVVEYPITYSPQLIEQINELSRKVEIRWLTDWEGEAFTSFAPHVGLLPFAVAERLPSDGEVRLGNFSRRWWKLDVIRRSIETEKRSILWCDDSIYSGDRKIVSEELAHIGRRLYCPNISESLGLRPSMFDEMDRFLLEIDLENA